MTSGPADDEFEGDGFDTPEEATLAAYPPGEARVLDVAVDGDRATVHVEVNRSIGYAVSEFCERHRGRWFDVGHTG